MINTNLLNETKNNLNRFEFIANPKKALLSRLDTPHIDLLSINEENNCSTDNINKYFSSFMRQIVDSKNIDFLNGNIDVIEYIISKFTNLEIKNIKYLERISLKLDHEFGLLNQFGQRLPNLRDLRLNGSNIESVMNIGFSFENLMILQINNCKIKDLSGKKIFL